MEWRREQAIITDDPRQMDLDRICSWLGQTYWAAERSREQIEKGISHSLCLGVFENELQVGFMRVVTDYATFSWVCDVVIDPGFRGKGYGKWLVACVIEHPLLQTTNMALGTKDAHQLYENYGGFERREMLRRPAGTPIRRSVFTPMMEQAPND